MRYRRASGAGGTTRRGWLLYDVTTTYTTALIASSRASWDIRKGITNRFLREDSSRAKGRREREEREIKGTTNLAIMEVGDFPLKGKILVVTGGGSGECFPCISTCSRVCFAKRREKASLVSERGKEIAAEDQPLYIEPDD